MFDNRADIHCLDLHYFIGSIRRVEGAICICCAAVHVHTRCKVQTVHVNVDTSSPFSFNNKKFIVTDIFVKE